jgi:hypothetical protein
LRIIYTIELGLIAGMYLIGLAARRDFAFSANHRDARAVAVLIHINAKRSGLLHSEREVRRVHLIQVAFPHFSHSKIDGALGDTRLQDVFVQV